MESPARPAPRPLESVAVLHVLPALKAGGAERAAVDMAAGLVQAGARVIVAARSGRMVEEVRAAGAEWLDFPADSKNPARMALNAAGLARIVRSNGVAIIHAHSRAPAWSAWLAARRTGAVFVTSQHGAHSAGGRLKRLYNSVMARGAAVIANSGFTADHIRSTCPDAAERIAVIPCGIDVDAFDPSAIDPARLRALRTAWGIAQGRRIVLLPGRLSRIKGQETLIDAAALLASSGLHDTDFVLAGEVRGRDAYSRELIARMLAAGLGHRVRLAGHCADMPAAYALADVVAVPSLVPETFGFAAVEAQAAGRPVVVSDLGATAETVLAPPRCAEEARTGWRVSAGDAQALAAALAQALEMRGEARAGMAARARAHVSERFSRQAMRRAVVGLYDRLLADAEGNAAR